MDDNINYLDIWIFGLAYNVASDRNLYYIAICFVLLNMYVTDTSVLIYIYIYIYIYIFAKFAVAFSSAIAKSIVKRITDGLLMLSQNCSSTNMHFHFKHKSDIQMIFLYFNFVFNNNNNNNRVNIELLTYMENVNCSGTHFSFEKKEEKKDKFMTALCF